MNADQRKLALETINAEAKAARAMLLRACANEGHKWDRPSGTSGCHEESIRVPSDDMDAKWGEGRTEYHTRFYWARVCTRCGFQEETTCNGPWKYDAGLGYYVCDPRTGATSWIDQERLEAV